MYQPYTKQMTIKEYTKNYKFPEQKQSDKEKENLNKSQNILLYKILKYKKISGNISMDSSINKTIENTLNNEEKKKKVFTNLKKKNNIISKTSAVSPSKSQSREGVSPYFFNGNHSYKINRDDYDSSTSKKYSYNNKTKVKKISIQYKAVTPTGNVRNKKNLNNSMEERKLYGAAYKKRFGDDNIFGNGYNMQNTSQNNNWREITPKKNRIESIRDNKNKNKKVKNNMKYNYLTSTYSSLIKQHEKINLSFNFNNNLNKIEHNNKRKKNLNNINFSTNSKSIRKKKEFENLQKIKVDLFTLNNYAINSIKNSLIEPKPKNLAFKNLTLEKSVELSLKYQNKKIPIKKQENKNSIKDQYTGFILLKKNLGNVEKEIKLENNIEELKSSFINIISEISKVQYEFILSNELLKLKNEINKNLNILDELNNIKSENILKNQKIIDQEEIIQKKEEEYFEYQKQILKITNNCDKLKQENEQMYKKIKIMENENKKLIEEKRKLREDYALFRNEKDEKMNSEIRCLEEKIKKYKEELKKTNNNNIIKNNFNIGNVNKKKDRFSVSYNIQIESLLNNLEKKKSSKKTQIPVENKIKEDIEGKEEKEEKEEKQNDNSESEKNMSDQLKEIEEENNNMQEFKEEKDNKKEEHIINNIIINNFNNNINNTNEIGINKVKTFENKSTQQENDDPKSLSKSILPEIAEEKQKKISRALNRFKKKVSQANQGSVSPGNYNTEKNKSFIKKSDRISGIAKLLEKQIGLGKKEDNNEMKNDSKSIIDKEVKKEIDIVDLIRKKPISVTKKKKPTINIKFN